MQRPYCRCKNFSLCKVYRNGEKDIVLMQSYIDIFSNKRIVKLDLYQILCLSDFYWYHNCPVFDDNSCNGIIG